jgi:hypothetical protein
MGKREDFIRKLKPIINDPEKLERFLIAHSNLPGPRGNLELAFGLAEIYNDLDVSEWIGKDKVIDKIIKENLKKNRVVSKNPDEVKELLNSI